MCFQTSESRNPRREDKASTNITQDTTNPDRNKLIPVKNLAVHQQSCGPRMRFRNDTLITATLVRATKEYGRFRRIRDVTFSLDRLEWMTMDLPIQTKETLMSLLNMKTDISGQFECIDKKITKYERMMARISVLMERRYRCPV